MLERADDEEEDDVDETDWSTMIGVPSLNLFELNCAFVLLIKLLAARYEQNCVMDEDEEEGDAAIWLLVFSAASLVLVGNKLDWVGAKGFDWMLKSADRFIEGFDAFLLAWARFWWRILGWWAYWL